jgi:hypothetical protein
MRTQIPGLNMNRRNFLKLSTLASIAIASGISYSDQEEEFYALNYNGIEVPIMPDDIIMDRITGRHYYYAGNGVVYEIPGENEPMTQSTFNEGRYMLVSHMMREA